MWPLGGILSTFSSRAAAVRARLGARGVCGQWAGGGRARRGSAHRSRWRASLSSGPRAQLRNSQTIMEWSIEPEKNELPGPLGIGLGLGLGPLQRAK